MSLNTWGGRAGREPLLKFLKEYKEQIDIFCLQEIWSAPYENLEGVAAGGKTMDQTKIMTQGLQDISSLLSDFQSYFRPHYLDDFGLLMMVRKNITVDTEGEEFVHYYKGFMPAKTDGGDIGNHARNIQYVTFSRNGRELTVINFHGLWNGKGKTDSSERLAQSQKIVDFIRTLSGEIVLIGDFNLLPDTESLSLLEKAGLRNLIKEYAIESTRTSLYDKPVKFADYALVSTTVDVVNFRVLPDEVSDHSPLLLEIS